MRFLGRVGASVALLLSFGFFTSAAEARQNSCDPDSELYNARSCFEYVRALEAKNANVKRDLAASRSETFVVRSQLTAAQAFYTRTSSGLRFDIAAREGTIRSLETIVKTLSDDKEAAWKYVDLISKLFAASIGFALFIGIIGFCYLRMRVSDYDRHAVEVRDEKIRALTHKLLDETAARLMACDDAVILRRELFERNPDFWAIKAQLSRLVMHIKDAVPRGEAIHAMCDRVNLLLRTHEERIVHMNVISPHHAAL